MGRFAGQHVLVTGACGGIGRAICRAYVAQGAKVALGDLPGAPAAELAAELNAVAPDSAMVLSLDVTDEAAWEAAVAAVVDRWGGLDILVNNAGLYIPNIPFEDMPLDIWRKHYAVNVDGTFLGCKHAIRAMKAAGKGGAIVNIGSGMSITANPTGSAYCSSKAAVLMTTRAAAKAVGKYNIRVNAVLPGAVNTDMLMGNLGEGDTPESYLQLMSSFSVLGRLASPEDIAFGVLSLSDPVHNTLTGVYLPVDGGNIPGG